MGFDVHRPTNCEPIGVVHIFKLATTKKPTATTIAATTEVPYTKPNPDNHLTGSNPTYSSS
ncbi:hypothetical protein GBA52_009153 [Prunus armeniaca]|nr:hypothetical protein GBA52_009153 [Prunus armeniaca]